VTFNLFVHLLPVTLGVIFSIVRSASCSSILPNSHPFFPQLLRLSPQTLTGVSSSTISAPVGVNPQCGIPRVGYDGSVGNVANIVVCGISILFVIYLIYLCNRRKAAVGTCLANFSSSSSYINPSPRPHRASVFPYPLPHHSTLSTAHDWLVPRTRLSTPRRPHSDPRRFRSRLLLVVAGQRNRLHPNCRRRNAK